MKKKFSKKWKASRQPRKQRKFQLNAPLHLRYKKMSATLSKELRKKHSMRNLEVRKGDTVKIMRGKFKKKQGKVLVCDLKKGKITIDGIQATKKEGTKVPVWFDASNVKIILLEVEDKKRLKKKIEGKIEKLGEKEIKLEDKKNAPKKK